MNNEHIKAQAIGGYIDYINNLRMDELAARINKIISTSDQSLLNLEKLYNRSRDMFDESYNSITKHLASNRGGKTGLHGFIAEEAEAGIVNSKRALEGIRRLTTVIDDNGPVDLKMGRTNVQVKFYNNILSGIRQSAKYHDQAMMFSKDRYEIIDKIMNGETDIWVDGNKLSLTKIKNIENAILEESKQRNASYKSWLRSSTLDYDDVQRDTIHKTMEKHQKDLKDTYEAKHDDIHKEAISRQNDAMDNAMPSVKEMHNASLKAAGFSGAITLGTFLYQKNKEGKKLKDLNLDDLTELGVDVGMSSGKAYISSSVIYTLTNGQGMSAPSASAITSGTMGLVNAIALYRTNQINDDDFIELMMFNTVDATGAAMGAAMGQALIPIPIVGAVIGSFVSSTALNLGKDYLNKKEEKLIKAYRDEFKNYINSLDKHYQEIFDELESKFNEIKDLQSFSFDLNNNIQLRFSSSIDLAISIGVEEEKVLKDIHEIDAFFLN